MNGITLAISGEYFWAFTLNKISEEGGDHTTIGGRIWNEEPVIHDGSGGVKFPA